MINPNKEYLQRIFASNSNQNFFDESFAQAVLGDESLEEMPNNPQAYAVLFALNRTLSRQDAATRRGLEVVGLQDSINALSTLKKEKYIDLFEVQTDQYIGTFFVFKDIPVGLAFVKREMAERRRGMSM